MEVNAIDVKDTKGRKYKMPSFPYICTFIKLSIFLNLPTNNFTFITQNTTASALGKDTLAWERKTVFLLSENPQNANGKLPNHIYKTCRCFPELDRVPA